MYEYWRNGFNKQDSRVICLEVYQKFLFDEQVKHLLKDIQMCGIYAQDNVVLMVKEGLWFNVETKKIGNGHIRMMFIDVLARRFLLRSHVILHLIQEGSNRNLKIMEIMTADFERYGELKCLPKEMLSEEYLNDPNHHNKMETEITTQLHDFDKQRPEDYEPTDEDIDPHDHVISTSE